MKFRQEVGKEGHWEPYLKIQLLPRCYVCHNPHPLASGIESENCLKCGVELKPLPQEKEVKPKASVRFINFLRKLRDKI